MPNYFVFDSRFLWGFKELLMKADEFVVQLNPMRNKKWQRHWIMLFSTLEWIVPRFFTGFRRNRKFSSPFGSRKSSLFDIGELKCLVQSDFYRDLWNANWSSARFAWWTVKQQEEERVSENGFSSCSCVSKFRFLRGHGENLNLGTCLLQCCWR